MSSQARVRFEGALSDAELLCLRGNASNLSQKQRRVQYHAALAASVAAWEAYLESVVREFLKEIADPLNLTFTALRMLLEPKVEAELKRFNTPNSSNSRKLIYESTGYDPINDWNWPAKSMSGIAVRGLVDEIIQVRHSFAHGYKMPAYSWNVDSRGDARLTSTSLKMVSGLFLNLVEATDRGLDLYIKGSYGKLRVWY
ncbi:hypothetical protein GCM10010156_68370 [Planobispora rosea]|uniref:RiboL-PSP-HEPN domain-containing protein n=1 Tax=Planobispora rosea TaxID=35762 RepID=A0A8J3S4C8_PLARO|nr:HEPN domain-containing protein [Planobispora rosea]GGT00608.1 hypothetical protein GCM10010156_68370 [Planobispora rosea]GIH88181.1 hypothetical protein Pro02_65890 [Planobispora rosea]